MKKRYVFLAISIFTVLMCAALLTACGHVHSYGEPMWSWSDDLASATAVFTCGDCKDEQSVTCHSVEKTTTATHSAAGVATYVAKVTFGGKEYVGRTERDEDFLPYDYGQPYWIWQADYSKATAVFECLDGCGESLSVQVSTKMTVAHEPTATESGTAEFVATTSLDGVTNYSDSRTSVLPPVGYLYGEPVWQWSEDFSTAVALFVCTNAEDVSQTVVAEISFQTTATHFLPGVATYTATAQFEGQTYSDVKIADAQPIPHSYGEPTWSWTDDFTTATAIFACQGCGDEKRIVASVSEQETTAPGITTEGEKLCTASVESDGKIFTASVSVAIPPVGYLYAEPTYEWADDFSTATATRVCTNDASMTETETVATARVVASNSSCVRHGSATYYANFKNPNFVSQSQKAELPLVPHDYSSAPTKWNWAADNVSAKAVCECSVCHSAFNFDAAVTVDVVPVSSFKDGKAYYVASVDVGGKTYRDEKIVVLKAGTHTHIFDQKIADRSTLAETGTSVSKAKYYYTCGCGAHGTSTFSEGNSDWGYQALGQMSNGAKRQQIYKTMYDQCLAFASSTADISDASFHFDSSIGILPLTNQDFGNIFSAFRYDNPQFYWLSGTWTYYTTAGTVTSARLRVLAEYAAYSDRVAASADVAEMDAEVNSLLGDATSQFEIAFNLHNWLVDNMVYAYDSAGKPESAAWAHSMIGTATYKAGVCETFSKTYRYVCTNNALDCISVVGNIDGRHAWNAVQVEGRWYYVDCTWDNSNSSSTIKQQYFLSGAEIFNQNHFEFTSDNMDGAFWYDMPQMSEQTLAAVELYKNGDFVGVYGGVDGALAAVDSRIADYEIRLGVSSYKDWTLSVGLQRFELNFAFTPKTGSIAIVGNYANNAYPTLTVWSDVVMESDLKLSDVSVVSGGGLLNMQSYDLATFGTYVSIGVPVKGSTSESAPTVIDLATLGETAFDGDVSAYELSTSRNVTFGGDVNVQKLQTSLKSAFTVTLSDGATAYIGDYSGAAKLTAALNFKKLADMPKLTIGNVSGSGSLEFKLNGYVDYAASSYEKATPQNVTSAIATLGNVNVPFAVSYVRYGGSLVTVDPSEYFVNSDGEVRFFAN